MAINRRQFLSTAAAAAAVPIVRLEAQRATDGRKVFLHGVASGDPLADRVIVWTRVTPGRQSTADVTWELSADPQFRRIISRGAVTTGAVRDFTVKIDVGMLDPARTYYYRFIALGERSPAGRTRTLPAGGVERVRLAMASCSNLPFGYFSVYRRIAARPDLDAVLHLGDYVYEYPNARYGDGTALGRVPEPDREIVTLEDYRLRHAHYKRDPDLQEVHRQHPFISVWDDHELANNTWHDGAENHNAELGEGAWAARRAAAVQAYLEWMPVREDRSARSVTIYRTFSFGNLADLIMLDTRLVGRDRQAAKREEAAIIDDPRRSLLGRAQEEWLFAELKSSNHAAVRWQLLGQQVMFAPGSLPGAPAMSTDTWDGYRPSRDRVLDAIEAGGLRNVVVLTGDVHSSWAYDVPRRPWSDYNPDTGAGTAAIEIVVPAVTSPSGFGTPEQAARRVERLQKERPHLRWVEGLHRGYVVLDVTRERVQAEWYGVPTVTERTDQEKLLKSLLSAAGEPHLRPGDAPAAPGVSPPLASSEA